MCRFFQHHTKQETLRRLIISGPLGTRSLGKVDCYMGASMQATLSTIVSATYRSWFKKNEDKCLRITNTSRCVSMAKQDTTGLSGGCGEKLHQCDFHSKCSYAPWIWNSQHLYCGFVKEECSATLCCLFQQHQWYPAQGRSRHKIMLPHRPGSLSIAILTCFLRGVHMFLVSS